jgi:hypothetical protein
MIGTTRSPVNFILNKLRKLGFIKYNGGLPMHSSLLNIILHDQVSLPFPLPRISGGGTKTDGVPAVPPFHFFIPEQY